MSAYRAEAGDERLTIEEFSRLPDDDSYLHELVRGLLVREPRPGAQHGGLVVELAVLLHEFVRSGDIGRVLVDSGFILSEDPPTVRGPDVAFVSSARIPGAGLPRGFIHGAPDLAVEVVSPSNTLAEIQTKVTQYLEAGGGLVWIVEPSTRTISVYQGDGSVQLLREADQLVGGDVLPGFRIPVRRVFEPG